MKIISDNELNNINGGLGIFFRVVFYLSIFKGFICGTALKRR